MKLKPCPFCGSEAIIFPPVVRDGTWSVVCQHPECGCNARILYCEFEYQAIEQWNRRTNDEK